MAITFTNQRYFTTNANQVLWDNQTSASLSFFFRFEVAGDPGGPVVNGTNVVGTVYPNRVSTSLVYGTAGSANIYFDVNVGGGQVVTTYAFTPGVVYHIAVTQEPGLQSLWVNAGYNWIGSASGSTQSISAPWQIGGSPPGTPCIFTISDVAIWNGYTLSLADVQNLYYQAQTPSQIGGATLIAEWTLAGTIGNTPTLGDPGLAEHGGNTTYDLIAVAGSGSSVYSAALTTPIPAGIKTMYVGTSGKTCVIFFENTSTSAIVCATSQNVAPTIYKNGDSLGQLTNPLITGYHNCVIYCLPQGTSVSSSDAVTLTAPDLWMNTAIGLSAGTSNSLVTNLTGKSAFGTESLVKTLKMGMNFPHLGTDCSTLYQVPKNWRYRCTSFWAATDAADGTPISYAGANTAAQIQTLFSANGLDNTGFPSLPGLYAVGWDDLNLSVPTTWYLDTDSPSTTTVAELSYLANTGDVNGVGKVRVFNVQQASGSTVANLVIWLYVQNDNKTPQFSNLVVYGPGDFSYDSLASSENPVPVVLDKSDPYALSHTFLDRFHTGLGSARWLDSTIGYGGATNTSEPEESRLLSDFTWGGGNTKVYRFIGYSQARAYSAAVSPYIYSTFFGTPYSATLAQNITTTPAAGTQETYVSYFTDAIAAPILAGLTLTMPSGEIMRVISVSGTDPNATVIVARGAENSTVAQQAAATIQVNNRLSVNLFNTGGNINSQIVELVTSDTHGVKTGQYASFQGSSPTLTFTDSSTTTITGNIAILVTGANTFVSVWGGATAGPVTITSESSPVTLNPAVNYTPWILSEVGFPHGFVALATGQFAGCDLHATVPITSSNTLIDSIAREIRDNFPAGRNIWIEMADEPWNNFFTEYQQAYWLTNLRFPGESLYTWWIVRTGEICQRFIDRFNEGGRNRGSEIKSLINVQAVVPSAAQNVLSIAAAKNVTIDAIATAPYLGPDNNAANIQAWNAADDEQAIDLWIHDVYYNNNGYSTILPQYTAYIDAYNTAYDKQCVLYAYEGDVAYTVPESATYSLQRTRDMIYNPNWYIIEHDIYAFYQAYGFSRFETYAYAMAYSSINAWGMYHSIGQPYGRGDGSDGKADNRLCLATPGLPYTKEATTNQDQQNVSVRGQAFIDWMQGMLPEKKPRYSPKARFKPR